MEGQGGSVAGRVMLLYEGCCKPAPRPSTLLPLLHQRSSSLQSPLSQSQHPTAPRNETHLSRNPCMLHHRPSIRRKPTHRASNMRINLHNLLDRVRVEQRGLSPLLDGQDDALRGLDPDGGGAELDGFDGVFDWW